MTWWKGIVSGRPFRSVVVPLIPALFILFSLGGCGLIGKRTADSSDARDRSREDAPAFVEEEARPGSVFDRPAQRLIVEFKVHRFSASAGAFSKSGRLWKLVTGPLPDAATTLRLGDNGFRAAVGRESDRAALREWLDSLDDMESVSDTSTPDASRLVEMDLGRCVPRMTVFHYDRGGSLHGLDFLDARARFKLAFEIRAVNLQTVRLTVVPEIVEPPGPPKWVITEDGARQEPQRREHTFGDLTFVAEVPKGGFLLLGPTSSLGDHPLVGRPFFIRPSVDVEDSTSGSRESIYVISPIIRTYTRARGQATGR